MCVIQYECQKISKNIRNKCLRGRDKSTRMVGKEYLSWVNRKSMIIFLQSFHDEIHCIMQKILENVKKST